MKFRFCMKMPGGYILAEHRFYLDDDGYYCEAPATRKQIEVVGVENSCAQSFLGHWRPKSKFYHCVPMPSFKERFPSAHQDS